VSDANGLLDRLADHGERFRLLVAPEDETGWIPCDRLLDPGSAELDRVLEAERVASGQVSDHATVLTVMAVYAGTVTAPALLAWALGEGVLDVRPENMCVRLSEHHGFEAVALREVRLSDGDEDDEATLVRWAFTDHLLPLAEAMHRRTRAGRRQLLGGIAQGSAAAVTVPSRTGDADRFARAWDRLVAATREVGCDLDRVGDVVRLREAAREGLFYLRDTCCLYYTSAERELCASCCLTPREERVAAYRRFLRELD
jgi:hypothetical protein